MVKSGGLGVAAISYVAVDYLRHVSPAWHAWLQPALWTVLGIAAISRVASYKHWSLELRSAIPFVAAMVFMLSALLLEALSVRSVTAVLGLDWHSKTDPLPDTGQWVLLDLNEKLPGWAVEILRARIIGLHHFLMLFIMLAFSVLFDSVRAPGLGLGARYMFTMGVGRLLRAVTFASTILPSARPWCANTRFRVPAYPHRWAHKYYVPYSSDPDAIREVIRRDVAYVGVAGASEYRPEWGRMGFLVEFLRPTASEGGWFSLLKKAGGGCNDLIYSGHMLVAVLTAMAWTEAYGGYSSAVIWALVVHSAQREVRERHHYSVDCVVAIYVGVLLWRLTGRFLWPPAHSPGTLDQLQLRSLIRAAKDSDMDKIRDLLHQAELSNAPRPRTGGATAGMWLFACTTIFFAIAIVLLAFTWTADG